MTTATEAPAILSETVLTFAGANMTATTTFALWFALGLAWLRLLHLVASEPWKTKEKNGVNPFASGKPTDSD